MKESKMIIDLEPNDIKITIAGFIHMNDMIKRWLKFDDKDKDYVYDVNETPRENLNKYKLHLISIQKVKNAKVDAERKRQTQGALQTQGVGQTQGAEQTQGAVQTAGRIKRWNTNVNNKMYNYYNKKSL
jgi:hypothetical protein